ncbi:MAG TPA: transferase [Propionibacteriaceae bacterium]|nr:transferase [Propionibacteriaceae bacterium]
MLTDSAIAHLRDDLVNAGYRLAEVTGRLGEAAVAGLARNSAIPARRGLAGQTDPQADLIRLWLLADAVPLDRARRALGAIEELLAAGLLIGNGDQVRATVELKPYGDDELSAWICSDPTPLDGRSVPPRHDFVLGASPASTTLAQLIPRDHVETVLDLGTGCGIQALHLAEHVERIVATDLNPRALQLATITLGLAQVEADLRLGSLYEPVAAERFDLIVTNPPYVISPPARSELVYREGRQVSDGLMRTVVTEAVEHLNPDGTLIVLGNWALTDQPWEERLSEWIAPTGCDALVLQREVLDPYEYVELWLADAGLDSTTEYAQRYTEWLDYFDDCGIRRIGMGWLALRASGREHPQVRIEDWPHAVHQPVGAAIAGHFAGVAAAQLSDEQLLARRWRRRPGVIQETIGVPGEADPQHLVLRQQYGLGRATEPGTAVAAVFGACDGELPLSVLIDAVGSLLGVEEIPLRAQTLTLLRRLISDGYLSGA